MWETSFLVANGTAGFGWFLMIVLPGTKLTRVLVLSKALPILLAFGYTLVVVTTIGSSEGDFFTLGGVRSLFQSDPALLAGWVHYLAFDMFVGIYEMEQAKELGISHLIMIPFLLATFWLGPMGYFLFVLLRSRYT